MTKTRNKAGMDAEAVARMMAAQDQEEPKLALQVAHEGTPAPSSPDQAPEFDPGKIDGRTLRRTGREPFATRIKPETHASLKRIAFENQITIAEALERAVAAYGRD